MIEGREDHETRVDWRQLNEALGTGGARSAWDDEDESVRCAASDDAAPAPAAEARHAE